MLVLWKFLRDIFYYIRQTKLLIVLSFKTTKSAINIFTMVNYISIKQQVQTPLCPNFILFSCAVGPQFPS